MDCVQDPGDLFSTKLISSGKGNGIILLKDLKASESKLQDKPIFSYTHYYSRKSAICCSNCFMNIGSLVENLNHVLKMEGKYVSPELEAKINSFKHQFPKIEGVKVMKCNSNCDFIFCSKECLEAASGTHDTLCKLMKDEEKETWRLFERYALKTHENFYFAGLIYINILYDSIYRNKPIKEWITKLNEFWSIPWDKLSTFDSNSTNPLDIASESFNILETCLKRFKNMAIENGEDVESLFSVGFYLGLLGIMDLVCVDIEIQNPLNDLLYNLLKDDKGKELVYMLSKDLIDVYKIIRGVEEVPKDLNQLIESKELFPDIIGLGLFNFISKMNHSCAPNLEVDYGKNNIANIIPLCDIREGDEATISYIDENDSFENRQEKLLKNYGFVCECTKCTLEGSNNNLEMKS
ncbi:SET domain protein [Theileria parva strain Muguga]|uniref:SET domain protein n=1 Tax=Theileria parva strain Muguga TaxID=333668 RepID=UPI001C61D1E3|nr:SET domain protein [Theileria parva strain Muguga]KAF5153537.1 SET domain protein [Theileria parva strain Muguga]